MRPSFSQDGLPGVDHPIIGETGVARFGTLFQYQRDPLVLYEGDEDGGASELGAVVARRLTTHLGGSVDVGETLSFRSVVPMGLQWRTEVPELAREGPVFGDVSLGGRIRLAHKRRVQSALSGDVFFPSGTPQSWFGEGRVRGQVGVLGAVRLGGGWEALGETGFNLRSDVPTQQDFVLSSEYRYSLAARYHVWPDRAALSAIWIAKSGLSATSGAAERPSELLAVLETKTDSGAHWTVGVGKGVADGYGTTEFRGLVGVMWTRDPRPPTPPAPVTRRVFDEAPPPPVEVPPPEPAEPEWEAEELAKVTAEKIVIREPIAFEFNTARLKETSLPTLQYVADLLNENWQIGHLVIEGHASDEGSFVYNYDLSIRRSRAIWEQLLRSGVHPDRMSYRGMGEVVPTATGEDEASLAANRRVEFRIVHQFADDQTPPEYRSGVRLPWDGTPIEIQPPVVSPVSEPSTEAPIDMQQFFDDIEAEMAPAPQESTESTPEGEPE